MWVEAERQNTEMAEQFGAPNAGGRNEYLSLEADYEQARNSFPLPKVPIILISAQRPGSDIADSPNNIWLDLHEHFVRRITGAQHIITEKSTHLIMMDDAQLVVNSIREVVDQVRNAMSAQHPSPRARSNPETR
jgi:pimeloyl-ACP methyl ester carboxylesterase